MENNLSRCSCLECYSKAVAVTKAGKKLKCCKCALAVAERFGVGAVESLPKATFPWDKDATIKCHHCKVEFNFFIIGLTGECPSCRRPLPKEVLSE